MHNKTLKFMALLAGALLLASVLTGCQNSSSKQAATTAVTAKAMTTIDPCYSGRDLSGTWDEEQATKISLHGSSIAVSGAGAKAVGSTLTISKEGVYVLSGALADGQIIVDAVDTAKVQIVLNGASLTCADNAPIYIKQADKVFLTLAKNTTNTVIDGSKYTLADGEDEPDAAIFSRSNLTINGTGGLTVKAKYKNGIASKDDLMITGGTIKVNAVNDGLRGRDSVGIHDGSIVINAAQGDGLQANNDQDTAKGWISIDGGTLTITAGKDGIQAETVLQVTDGTVTVKTGGGSANASTDSKSNERPGWGKWAEDSAATSNDEPSAKGLKAKAAINIAGGKLTIDSSDDSVHANGDVMISNGTVNISSGDDGIHADASLVVKNGTIDIAQSYEGLESTTITINGGKININAKDDAFNATGGSNGSALYGRPGQSGLTGTRSSTGQDSAFIRITGGYVAVNTSGDGIDSNGSLYLDGGTVVVSGPTNNGNGPIDYTGVAEISGGTVAISGSSGMAQNFSDSSKQNSLLVAFSVVQKVGNLVGLQDASGNTILSLAPAMDYQSVLKSSPKLEQGKTYTLYSGGSASGKNTDGLYTDGKYQAGTKVIIVNLSEAATSISDTGEKIINMGGPGGRGGHGDPGDRPGMGGPRRGAIPDKSNDTVNNDSGTANQ